MRAGPPTEGFLDAESRDSVGTDAMQVRLTARQEVQRQSARLTAHGGTRPGTAESERARRLGGNGNRASRRMKCEMLRRQSS